MVVSVRVTKISANVDTVTTRRYQLAAGGTAHSISSTVFANWAGMLGSRWSPTPLASRRATASGCLSALSMKIWLLSGRTPACISCLTGMHCCPPATHPHSQRTHNLTFYQFTFACIYMYKFCKRFNLQILFIFHTTTTADVSIRTSTVCWEL